MTPRQIDELAGIMIRAGAEAMAIWLVLLRRWGAI